MLIFAVFGLVAGAAHAQDKLVVQVPAVYGPGAPVVEPVRRECAIESLVGNYFYSEISQRVPGAVQAPARQGGDGEHFLKLTILSVRGVGGGSWSGRKSISVRADLERGGKEVATTLLHRTSSGGALGGLSGTCAIMERIAVALGKDAVLWLQAIRWNNPAGVQPLPAAPAEPEKTAD